MIMRNEHLNVKNDNSFEMDYNRFVDYFMEQAAINYPDFSIKPGEDEWHFEISKDDDSNMSMVVNLNNVWENYVRTKDLTLITQFIEAQKGIADFTKNADKAANPDMVFPVVRPATFKESVSEKSKEMKVHTLFKPVDQEIDILYVQDHPQFITFLMDNMIPEGYTEESIKEKAFHNLKAQGWHKASESVDIQDIATIHFYHHGDKNYQAQFLFPELYKEHLGDYFFVGFPTRDEVVVLQWHKNPDEVMEMAKSLALTFIHTIYDIYGKGVSPLSPMVHSVKGNGDIKVLG